LGITGGEGSIEGEEEEKGEWGVALE